MSWQASYQRVHTGRTFTNGPRGAGSQPAAENYSNFVGDIDTVDVRGFASPRSWLSVTAGYEFEREGYLDTAGQLPAGAAPHADRNAHQPAGARGLRIGANRTVRSAAATGGVGTSAGLLAVESGADRGGDDQSVRRRRGGGAGSHVDRRSVGRLVHRALEHEAARARRQRVSRAGDVRALWRRISRPIR